MSEQHDKILDCACDLYLADGLDGFSMRKLAKQVGVTAPALYRHFESREHVLADVVREAHKQFTAALYRALEGRTALERFIRAGEAYLEFALSNARWYELLFISPEHMGMDELPNDIEAMGCAVHQFWVDRVRECMDERILREDDPVQVSLTMWAHAHGLLSLYHHGHFNMDAQAFREHFEASSGRMMRGLAADGWAREAAESHAAPAMVGADLLTAKEMQG